MPRVGARRVDESPRMHGRTSSWTAYYPSPITGSNYTAEVITERNAPGFVDLGKVTYTYADYFTNKGSKSIAATRLTLVTNLRQRVPIVLSGNAYKQPNDSLKDSFSTYYAANWLR